MSFLNNHLSIRIGRSRIFGSVKRFVGWYIILYIVSIVNDVFYQLMYFWPGNDRCLSIGSDFSLLRLSSVAVRTVIIIGILRIIHMTMPRWTELLVPFAQIYSDHEDEKKYREYLIYEAKHSTATRMLSNRIRTLIAIDSRISVLRTRAGLMLLSIGLLLVASILVIIFAGSLTSLDVSAVNDIDKLDSVINSLESKVALISNGHDLLAEREAATQAQQSDRAQAAQKKLDGLLQNSNYDGVPRSLPEVNGLLQSLLKEAWEKELTSPHGYSDTKYLIASAVTRIGVVLVIIFLVQILIGLYRYNMRLVTYYLARRDMVQLWDGNTTSLQDLEQNLTPNIEFGKEPRHPIEEYLKQLIAKIPGLGASPEEQSGTPKAND